MLSFLATMMLLWQQPTSKVITGDELIELRKNPDVQLVDIRTPEEWQQGVIEGASKINFYDKEFMPKIEKMDKAKPIVIYCAAGGRSSNAAKKLVTAGFVEVYDLGIGFRGWKAEGRPVMSN